MMNVSETSGNEAIPHDHALVPTVDSSDPHRDAAVTRPAVFLAHLIATERRLPQTCERRRAPLGEAIAAYRDTQARLSSSRPSA